MSQRLPSRGRGVLSRGRFGRRVSTVIGISLGAGAGAFVLGRIGAAWTEHGRAIAGTRWGWVAAAVGVAIVGTAGMSLVWRHIIVALGGHATRREVFVWYQIGNLGKYLPGGLWPLVGRSELGARAGLSRPVAYNSVALSMGATYLCAIIVCAVLLPFVAAMEIHVRAYALVFVLIPVAGAALHPCVLGPVLRLAERLFGAGEEPIVPPWPTSVRLVMRHSPPWLAYGVATWLVAFAFVPEVPVVPIVFAGILSWVIGFLVIVVPGGLGIREAAFVGIAGLSISFETAAVVAVASRLVFMCSDVLGASVALPLARRRTLDQQDGTATLS